MTDERRGRREHNPFRDELAGDARRRRAECAPHRDFLRPRGPACDEQPGDVHARNQQDERDRANEHIQRRPHAPQHDVGERFDEHTAAAIRGISAFQRRRNRPELALGRFRRLTRREPAEHEDRMGLARQRLRIGAQRDPDVDARGLAAIREAARIGRRRQELQRPEVAGIGHDADDGVRPFVEAEDAADRGGGAARGLPRERLADDRGIARADRIFLGGEPAAGNLTDAQHREQFPGHAERCDPERLAVGRSEIDLCRHQRRQRLDAGALAAEVEVIGHRRRLARRAAVAVGLPDHHEPVELVERRRPQQDRVHDAENGCVGADPERERQDGGRGESRTPGQQPQGNAKVLSHTVLRRKRAAGQFSGVVYFVQSPSRFPAYFMVIVIGLASAARGHLHGPE